MKKLIVLLALIVSATAYAQNDTILINKPVKFEYEKITTKSGKETIKYYAVIDGKYYDSNKTSVKRYHDAIKFGGKPNVAIISNKKKTNRKVIIL